MIKKFKPFISPISDLPRWLNEMSGQGYRLVRAGDVFYHFEECKKGKYVYSVDYVANKSYDDLKEYESFLEETNMRYIEKSSSIGKISKGNVRLRPYADKGAKIATSQGMIKREFLIIEKEKDNNPFEIYTNVEDKINALKIMRKPIISMMIFIGIILFISNINSIPQYRWSLFEFNLFSQIRRPLSLMIIGIIELLLSIKLIKFSLEINCLKKEGDIYD